MRKSALALILLATGSLFAETTKTVYNPYTGKLDFITVVSSSTLTLPAFQVTTTSASVTGTGGLSVRYGTTLSTLTVTAGATITNAATSGTSSTATVINTGDPNTRGLIVKGNTYTPAAKTPDQVSGLIGWWKADAIEGLNDGNSVTNWSDSSGNNNTLTAVTATKPVYKTSIVNGKPVVRFANNNDNLKTGNLTQAQPYTYIIVLSQSGTTNTHALCQNVTTGSCLLAITATTSLTRMNAGTGVSEATSSGSAWRIITAVYNGASSVGRVNGTQVIASNVGANGYSAAPFGLSAANPTGLNGDIAEVAFFAGAISDNDRLAVEAYLSTKYSITIAGSTPQTAALQEWQSSAGSLLSKVDASGNMSTASTFGFITTVSTMSAPSAANILAVNSASELYISTGTGAAAWVKVGGQ